MRYVVFVICVVLVVATIGCSSKATDKPGISYKHLSSDIISDAVMVGSDLRITTEGKDVILVNVEEVRLSAREMNGLNPENYQTVSSGYHRWQPDGTMRAQWVVIEGNIKDLGPWRKFLDVEIAKMHPTRKNVIPRVE
jgi:hypothetical protein